MANKIPFTKKAIRKDWNAANKKIINHQQLLIKSTNTATPFT
jgi:hypothetical protein